MTKITDLKKIIRYHAESGLTLTDEDKIELAGCLLNRDMRGERFNVIEKFFREEGYYLWDLIAAYLFDRGTDTTFDLLNELERLLVAHYEPEIDSLIKEMEQEIKEEPRVNPNHEYNPDLEEALQ